MGKDAAALDAGTRHMNLMVRAQIHVAAILSDVRHIEDPLERLVVARDVFAILRDATETLGPQGLRGQAAAQAVAQHGSAQAAADASPDDGVTRSVIVRLTERYTEPKEGQ